MSGSGLHSPAKINKAGQIHHQSSKNHLINIEKDKSDGHNSELLEVIADLVLKHEIVENRLSLRIKEAKEYRLMIEDLSRTFCFEVWWHDNEREAIREAAMHRILREHPLPNLLTADLDFEFKGRKYLLRRKGRHEISLAEYIRAPDKPFTLQLEHIIEGIEALHNLQSWSQNGYITKTRPIIVSTVYSADHTMIIPTKEGGFDFKYQVTNEISLMALNSHDNIGEVLYSSAAKEYLWSSYPVYASIAEVAEQIGADSNLVELIRCKGMHDFGTPLPIDDILGKGLLPSAFVRATPPAEPVTVNETLYLEHLADLLLQHSVVKTRPVLTIQDRKNWRHVVVDQNNNMFEVFWYYGLKEQGLKELAIHNIIRGANLPHLITAEFEFEFEGSFALVLRHSHTDFKLCTAAYTKKLGLKDLLKGVYQISEFFKQALVPMAQLSAKRPLSVTSKRFTSQDLWLIPDGNGGYDFKFAVNSEYEVMKIADDGVGILVYRFEPAEDPYYSVFETFACIADELGFADLYELICDLDPHQRDFDEKIAAVMRYDHQFAIESQ